MDVVNDDDAAAMASIMGMNGFGTTKVEFFCFLVSSLVVTSLQGKQVVGNQEGGVNIKKIRTWRQYMNRYAIILEYWSILLTS
jgi:U4/U6.U5 tri-snRNP-associated protein 3